MENTFRYGIDLTKNESGIADEDEDYASQTKETMDEYKKEVEQKIEEFRDIAIIYKKINKNPLDILISSIVNPTNDTTSPDAKLKTELIIYMNKIQESIPIINSKNSEDRNQLANVYRDYEMRGDVKGFVNYVNDKVKDQNQQSSKIHLNPLEYFKASNLYEPHYYDALLKLLKQ